jgi:hypothetical protein
MMRKFPESPPSLPLKRAQVRELLESLPCEPDPELTDPIFHMDAYRVPNGKLLFVIKRGRGVLYESRQAYIDYERECIAYNSNPGHMFDELMPGRDVTFLADVPQLVDSLAEKLCIPRDKLDGSIDSMRLVDRRSRRDPRGTTPELYPELVAYVGEVMRAQTGGRWENVVAESDGETLEPWVVGPDGRRYNPFIVVARALDAPPYLITGMLLGEIGPRFRSAPRGPIPEPS